MQFDEFRPTDGGCLDLLDIGIDEQADRNPRRLELTDHLLNFARLSSDVESAFGGDFFASFRNQGHVVGFDRQRNADHFIRGGHFQIQVGADGLAQNADVAVLDVPPVFAQVDGNTIGSGQFHDRCGGHWIGFDGTAGLTNRGDVVDVDSQGQQGSILKHIGLSILLDWLEDWVRMAEYKLKCAIGNAKFKERSDSMTVATDRRMTLEEYLTYDDGTDTRYELVDGVLVEMGAESTINTLIAVFLITAFVQMGVPTYRMGIKQKIQVDSSDVSARDPDLIVHTEESLQAILGRSEACLKLHEPNPIVVVEVVSPGEPGTKNYDRDYVQKLAEYAARKIGEYWLIDPVREVVLVLTLKGKGYQRQQFKGNQLIVSPSFPSMNLTAAQVLRGGI
jgi:Uma2 family endonuclease